MKIVLLLLLFFLSIVSFSQPIKVTTIDKEWTDSTTVHSFYVFTQELEANSKIDLKLFFRSDIENRILNITSTKSVFSFDISKLKSDSLLKIEAFENTKLTDVTVSSFNLKRLTLLTYSPLLSFNKINSSTNDLIPSNNFHPDFDTLIYQFYTEFNGTSEKDRFGYHFYIINSNTDTVISFYKRIKDNLYTYNRGSIAAYKLQTGRYKMRVEFIKNNETIAFEESNEFYVLSGRKNIKTGYSKKSESSEYVALFSSYTLEELDELFSKAQFLSAKSEKELYFSLKDLQSKRAFMVSFWENRKNNEIENFDSFILRVSTANSMFGTKFAPGTKTDKGRIFLKYGLCDDIYTSNMSSETKPYEVWYYPNIQNGIYFFFVDLNNYGEFKLIHSTAENEIYNPSQLYNLGIDKDNYRK